MRWARYLVPFTLLGLLFTSQVWVDYAYAGHRLTWPRAMAVALAEWYAWLPAAPVVIWLSARLPLERRRWPVSLAVHVPASLLCTFLTILAGTLAARSITGVTRPPFSFLQVHLHFFTYWAIVAVGYAADQLRIARERERRTLQLEAQLAQAQLQALRMKLHPHFLFNTLNAIAALMREDVEAADVMIAHLSDLLRQALDTADIHEVPLRRELDFLETYLEIERARAGERLTTRLLPAADTLDLLVPTLMLQPLVENAIRHGAHARPGPALVELGTRRDGEKLVIEVADDGPGTPAAVRAGHGLRNTEARLGSLYGTEAELVLTARPGGGTIARLVIPARRAGDALEGAQP